MMAATVGMAIGQNSDVTAEAAGVVALESSLKKVDEFMHISRRMRAIVLQSALGGNLQGEVARCPAVGAAEAEQQENVGAPRPDAR